MKISNISRIHTYKLEISTFLIGMIFIFPYLQVHYDFDAYCLLASDYQSYAQNFFGAGRFISGIVYLVLDFINFPYSLLSVISIVLSVLWLSLSIVKMFKLANAKGKEISSITQLILYLSIILIFYNFSFLELNIFMESFIMCFGIFCIVCSIEKFIKASAQSYIQSILWLHMAIISYQGVMSLYFPLLAAVIFIKNKREPLDKQIKIFFVEGLKAIIFYGITFFVSYFLIHIYLNFSHSETAKIGHINLWENIKQVPILAIDVYKHLFYLYSPYLFCIFLALSIMLNIFLGFIHNKRYQLILYLIIIFLCFFSPFIPNLAMRSEMNYTAARLTLSLGSSIGISFMILVSYFDERNVLKTGTLCIIICYFLSVVLTYNNNLSSQIKKYQKDMETIEMIAAKIVEYEEDNGILIDTIYYAYDSYTSYFYPVITIRNGFTYRLYSCDWGMECAVNAFIDKHKFIFKEMDYRNYQQYFQNKEYDSFSDEQFVFINNELYLLLY